MVTSVVQYKAKNELTKEERKEILLICKQCGFSRLCFYKSKHFALVKSFGQVVAFAGYMHCVGEGDFLNMRDRLFDYVHKECIYIVIFGVLKHLRGNGLGKYLYRSLKDTGNVIYAHVRTRNESSICLHKSSGFEIAGRYCSSFLFKEDESYIFRYNPYEDEESELPKRLFARLGYGFE